MTQLGEVGLGRELTNRSKDGKVMRYFAAKCCYMIDNSFRKRFGARNSMVEMIKTMKMNRVPPYFGFSGWTGLTPWVVG